ncbi:MAG: class I tRNA ligase family protein, partial [Anaerovoracaceae bacterium]
VSRNRYWGTPIPVWRCECGHLECIGSREELVEKAQEDIDTSIELHRPYVDDVHLTCPHCGKPMTRIPEVMDCWFDSGSMPFAQQHYPFENKENFDECFPADFICEGIDQTRGWFYSLLAISTFIMGKAPYKNVLVNDLILDKEGKKMSKSKGNTVDPFALFDKYGADVARWYLLYTSPAWSPTKFDEEGVQEIQSKYFGTLRNVYNFFVLYSNTDDVDIAGLQIAPKDRPELDRWILSRFNALVRDVTVAMDNYEHMKAVKKITEFVAEDLSNWYIRRARRRFYAEEMTEDKKAVLLTTYEMLRGAALLSAPFAPFIADEMYTKLTGEESVHLAFFPEAEEALIDTDLEEKMELVRTIVTLGRGEREKEKIKVRQPLSEILVDSRYEEQIGDMVQLIMEELNVKAVVFEKNMDTYMNYSLKPDFRKAGPVLGGKVKEFGKALAAADAKEVIARLGADDKIVLSLGGEDTEIPGDLIEVRVTAKEGFAVGTDRGVFVILGTQLTPELISEGLARELISKVQQMRKQKNLEMMDNIYIHINCDEESKAAFEEHRDYIMKETLALQLNYTADSLEEFKLNGHITGIAVEKA